MTTQGKPVRCPRCGSTKQSERKEVYSDSSLYDFRECPNDDWHSPVPAAAPQAPENQPSPSGDAKDLAIYILTNWAYKYVHPEQFNAVNPQSTINNAINKSAAKAEDWLRAHDAKVEQAKQTVDVGGKFNADMFWVADDPESDCEPQDELEENYAKGQIVEFQAASRMPNFFGFWLPKANETDDSEFFFFNTKAEAEAALKGPR